MANTKTATQQILDETTTQVAKMSGGELIMAKLILAPIIDALKAIDARLDSIEGRLAYLKHMLDGD